MRYDNIGRIGWDGMDIVRYWRKLTEEDGWAISGTVLGPV